jgi:phage-related protein
VKRVKGWFRIQAAEKKCSKSVKGCSKRGRIRNEDIGNFLTT